MKLFICLLLISYPLTTTYRCFGQTQPLTAEIRKQTIGDLAVALSERYAYKEVGHRLRQLLEQNLRAGKYDAQTSPIEFSIAVTNDLRSVNSDKHLALNYSPQTQTTNTKMGNRPPLSPEEQAERDSAFNRQMNYGFKNVQFLNGNIGYLKFNYFDAYLNYSSPIVDASMTFFKNCDALIIDLRDNGGGGSQMVGYIAGFFFKEQTLSGTSYNRLDDTTTEEFITPQPKEKQLPQMDLYILTSKSTISAAEALAYNLKYLRGAKVVGETSAGAANPSRVTRLNTLFTAVIPNRHGKNVVTGTNWEGTGVPVDIACPAEDALRVANIEALKQLRQEAIEPSQQTKFDSYISFLERTKPKKEVSETTLRQYAGEYQGGRTVALTNGKLHYSRVAEVGGELHLISPDLFMLSEGDVTIIFKRDKQNRVVGMEYRWSLASGPNMATKTK